MDHDMPPDGGDTQGLLDRLAAGDERAADDLIAYAMERVRLLARRLLRDDPAVRRWEQTDDVLQNALLRLHRAVKATRPATTRDFINLAATQIRRELKDLFRHHYGPEGHAAHHKSDPGAGTPSVCRYTRPRPTPPPARRHRRG